MKFLTIKKQTKKQLFAVFVLLMFIGSGIAIAISSSLFNDTEQNPFTKAQLILFLKGEREEIEITSQDKIGILLSQKNIFFNSTCIKEFCNTGEEKLKLYVNGEPNYFFENYIPQDNDLIVIEFT